MIKWSIALLRELSQQMEGEGYGPPTINERHARALVPCLRRAGHATVGVRVSHADAERVDGMVPGWLVSPGADAAASILARASARMKEARASARACAKTMRASASQTNRRAA